MERNKYLISSRGCSVCIYSKKKHEKKWEKRWEGGEKKGEGDGWMEGQTDGQRGGVWRARKLIIQLVCWDTGRGSDASY